jgi:hypothetical protein
MLIEASEVPKLRRYAATEGAHLAEIDVSGASDSAGVIGAMKVALPFPTWCGSSWDSIDDAFDELRSSWHLPLVLVVGGYDRLLAAHQHLGLETVIRFHELAQAFSAVKEQLIVVFEGTSWS